MMNGVVGTLVTILAAVVSIILTWYFSRRRYRVQAAPTTLHDVQIERLRQEERRKSRGRALGNIGMAVFIVMALMFALALVIFMLSR